MQGARTLQCHVRARFYVYCNKRGSLWNYTDWWPFLDYEVNPTWITSFLAVLLRDRRQLIPTKAHVTKKSLLAVLRVL